MKAEIVIKINETDNYKEINFKTYQYFIEKRIYLSYDTKPDIIFIVRQLNK